MPTQAGDPEVSLGDREQFQPVNMSPNTPQGQPAYRPVWGQDGGC